jgi:signal transduction histidine kinase
MRALRVLLAEDSEDDELLARQELRGAGFDLSLERVDRPETLRRALAERTWDIVLSDYSMPQFTALDVLREVQASSQPDLPVVIVSGSIGELSAVAALKAGAANYVLKENMAELVPVVERELSDAAIRRERLTALQALEQAIRARDEFLSIASHELRTPLTALHLKVERLLRSARRHPTPPLTMEEVERGLQAVTRSSTRLMELIDRLLDVTRITTGNMTLFREEVDVVAVTRAVLDRLAELVRQGGSSVCLRAPAAVVGRWDRERLEIVLTNLLSNAAKYGEAKPIDVEVEDLGAEVRLRVIDRGIGIAPDDQRRIFERFERAVPERHFGGLGVGLWLSCQIAKAHGGIIEVASAPGVGSTFTMTLPKEGEHG